MNKKQLMVAWVISLLVLSGCSCYDEGYEDGYEGVTPNVLDKLSSSYKEGYSNGAEDVYYFDLGYRDARNGEEPSHPGLSEYMEGYREGQ